MNFSMNYSLCPRMSIAAFRHNHGMSQSDLARMLPVPVSTLRKWEQGTHHVPPYLWRALRDLAGQLEETK